MDFSKNIIISSILLFILNFPANAICGPELFDSLAQDYLMKLNSLTFSTTSKTNDYGCHRSYTGLYNDNTMKFSIFIGAMDTPSNTCIDRPAKDALVKYLTQDCKVNLFACGFSVVSFEPTVLEKLSNSKKVILSIYDSSVSEDLRTNLVELTSEQQRKSEYVASLFLDSLKNENVVFYIGHSRYGTGPGFYHFPFLSAHWASTFFRSPLKSAIIHNLRSFSPQLLGLFSCNSQRYYAREIHDAAPKMAMVVSTGMVTFDSCIIEAVAILNLIMGNTCWDEFDIAFRETDKTSKFKLYGLFQGNSFPRFETINSIYVVTIFIFIAPVLALVPKLFSTKKFTPFFKIASLSQYLFLLFISCILGLGIVVFLLTFNNEIYNRSIPLFFILLGILLLSISLILKDISLKDIMLYLKGSISSLAICVALYYGMNLFPLDDHTSIITAFVRTSKFILLFLAFLPFFIINSGIIEYPFLVRHTINLPTCVIITIITSSIICIITTFFIVRLDIYLFPYKEEIFLSLLYTHLIPILIYLYKTNTILMIIFQCLTFAILFAENIHDLF